jgi:hypothetical protein
LVKSFANFSKCKAEFSLSRFNSQAFYPFNPLTKNRGSEKMPENAGQQPSRKNRLGMGIAIGIAIGAAIGAATGNIGFWVAVGVPLGVACGFAFSNTGSKHKNED